jgi:hypothetical protein
MGKCKQSVDGKIILLSGAMVPKSIQGTWLCDWLDEYHKQNPNQLAAATMLCTVAETVTVATLIQAEPDRPRESKVVCFDLQVGQPRVFALRKQPTQASKGKAPQEGPRITEVHSNDDSEAEPAQFTRELIPSAYPTASRTQLRCARS